MPDQRPPSPRASDAAVPRSAWVLLGMMTALNVLNFVDRQLISSLAPLLIADLGLSRSQIGLLVGFTFVVFYTLVGMLLGVAADRWSRRAIIAWGLGLWSVMTALSGAARSFLHLALPRVLVGVGEATLTPAALSMLGDAFPVRRLGLATGIYYAGLPIGTALSLGVAGWVAPRFGWRVCFYVFGLVGLAAVGLLFRRARARAAGGCGRAGIRRTVHAAPSSATCAARWPSGPPSGSSSWAAPRSRTGRPPRCTASRGSSRSAAFHSPPPPTPRASWP